MRASYSNSLSIWDRLGRTHNRGSFFAEPRFGLDGLDEQEQQTLRVAQDAVPSDWGQPSVHPHERRSIKPIAPLSLRANAFTPSSLIERDLFPLWRCAVALFSA